MINGKGSKPRSCFSDSFKKNYDSIHWTDAKVTCRVCGEQKGQKKFTRMNLKTKTGICKKCS